MPSRASADVKSPAETSASTRRHRHESLPDTTEQLLRACHRFRSALSQLIDVPGHCRIQAVSLNDLRHQPASRTRTALTRSPVSSSSCASRRCITWRHTTEIIAGATPTRTSLKANFASAEATAMSHAATSRCRHPRRDPGCVRRWAWDVEHRRKHLDETTGATRGESAAGRGERTDRSAPGAEGRAAAGQHDDTHLRILSGRVEMLKQQRHGLRVKTILRLGPVEGDGGHSRPHAQEHRRIGRHFLPIPSSMVMTRSMTSSAPPPMETRRASRK